MSLRLSSRLALGGLAAAALAVPIGIASADTDGRGQFRLDDGDIVEEGSKVLVLLHEGGDDRSAAIDAIRADDVDQFDQQSVLRTDTTSCVGF
jgi:Protein of unknown function (DUF3574)